MKPLGLFLSLLIVTFASVACSTDDEVQPIRNQLATATFEKTPVPLLLTPITTPVPLPTLPPLTNNQSSRALAQTDDLLITVNSDSDSVTLVDKDTRLVVEEIEVGDDPRTVAVTPDGSFAVVTLRGQGSVALVNLQTNQVDDVIPVGHMPYGAVTDGQRAYVSCFGSDKIIVVNLASASVLYQVDVPDGPAGLALSGDWLLITHFYTGNVTLLNVKRTPIVVGTISAETDGVLAQSIVIAPDGQRAYLPQMRTGLALISLQYMQDWFPVVSVLDIINMSKESRIVVSALDGHPANMPFDAAFSPDGNLLYVVLAGSNAISAIRLPTQEIVSRIAVGVNPRGIVIDGDYGFVLNALDATVSVLELSTGQVIETIPVSTIPLDPVFLRGKILFHSADSKLSDGAISCATCHFDGGADGRTWINFRSGPRNTPALGNAADLPPYNWAGDMAEMHDTIEDQIRYVMLGDGLIDGDFDATIDRIDAGRSPDLDALVAYVSSFRPWPSPNRNPDGTLTEAAQRGMSIFSSGSPDCRCHSPPEYTDQQQHNLANFAFSLEEYDQFDTPTLYGLWATAPYMHDGVVQTLEELFMRSDPAHMIADKLSPQELSDLIAFLLSL